MTDCNIWPRGGQAKTSAKSAAMATSLNQAKPTFQSSKMVIDWGASTADAVRQPNGN